MFVLRFRSVGVIFVASLLLIDSALRFESLRNYFIPIIILCVCNSIGFGL